MELTRRMFVKAVAAGAGLLSVGCVGTRNCLPAPNPCQTLPAPPENFIRGRKLVRVEWLDVDIEELKVHEWRTRGVYNARYYYNAVGKLALRRLPRRLWGVDPMGFREPKEVEFYQLGGGRILIPLEQWGNRVPDLYA